MARASSSSSSSASTAAASASDGDGVVVIDAVQVKKALAALRKIATEHCDLTRLRVSLDERHAAMAACYALVQLDEFRESPQRYMAHHGLELSAPSIIILEEWLGSTVPGYSPLYASDALSDRALDDDDDMGEADWQAETMELNAIWSSHLRSRALLLAAHSAALAKSDGATGSSSSSSSSSSDHMPRAPKTALEEEFMRKIWRDLESAFACRAVPFASARFCGKLGFPRLLAATGFLITKRHPSHGKCHITGEDCRKNSLFELTMHIRVRPQHDGDTFGTRQVVFQVCARWKEFIEACYLAMHFDEVVDRTVRSMLLTQSQTTGGVSSSSARKAELVAFVNRQAPAFLGPLLGMYKWVVQTIYKTLHDFFVPEDAMGWTAARTGPTAIYMRDVHRGWFFNTTGDVAGLEEARRNDLF